MTRSKEAKSQTVPYQGEQLRVCWRFHHNDIVFDMDVLAGKILAMFSSFNKETLDLHELFEAGGNDPDARTAVLDRVERLVQDGLLEERGNDFYALTREGRLTIGHDH
jgi:hypothetical protein